MPWQKATCDGNIRHPAAVAAALVAPPTLSAPDVRDNLGVALHGRVLHFLSSNPYIIHCHIIAHRCSPSTKFKLVSKLKRFAFIHSVGIHTHHFALLCLGRKRMLWKPPIYWETMFMKLCAKMLVLQNKPPSTQKIANPQLESPGPCYQPATSSATWATNHKQNRHTHIYTRTHPHSCSELLIESACEVRMHLTCKTQQQ